MNTEIKQKQDEANRIIDALEGTSKVAEMFEITTGAVSQWRDEGIPKPRMQYIKLLRPDLFQKSA